MTEQQRHLQQLAKPLAEYLKAHYNPHCAVIVTLDRVRIVADELSIPFEFTQCDGTDAACQDEITQSRGMAHS